MGPEWGNWELEFSALVEIRKANKMSNRYLEITY
jgi:hypothetical protein